MAVGPIMGLQTNRAGMTSRRNAFWAVPITLLLVLSACSDSGQLTPGEASKGQTLVVGIEEIIRVQELRFQGTDQKHYLVTPSNRDNELVAVRLTVSNEDAAVVQMIVNEEAAQLRGFGPNERYQLLDLYRLDELSGENLQVVEGSHPSENLYVPFIAGPIELQQGLSVVGWVVFEVPNGIKLRQMRWGAGDTVFVGGG